MRDACCDVVEEASDCCAHRKIGAGTHSFDIGIERCNLIADEVEVNVVGIGASCGKDLGPQPWKIDLGGATVGVVHDCDAINFKLVH